MTAEHEIPDIRELRLGVAPIASSKYGWKSTHIPHTHSVIHISIHWVKVLHPTRHNTGHFGDVPQANLLAWCGKTKPNTTKAHIHQSKEMHNTHTQKKQKTKARFICLV